MPRQFKDLITDEESGELYISLINRDGTVAMRDVKVSIASRVLQQGDKFGALAANTLLLLDDSGAPVLNINGGTY